MSDNPVEQNKTKKMVDITPHKSLMLKVGQTGYSLAEALAELIDNAIDAKKEGGVLEVEIEIASDSITVSDTGVGMSETEAVNAIRLGFSEKSQDLGEFGLGLKTASTFLGKKFTVVTTQEGDSNEYVLTFDEDEWMEAGSWTDYPFVVCHDRPPERSGTEVRIENLKIDIEAADIDQVKAELSTRFGPFIEDGDLKLYINGEQCSSPERGLLGDKHEFDLTGDGFKISGWWGYQLRGFNKEYFGFNTFRRGRLVTTFDKIGLNPNQDIKQIIGEIEIEGVPIAHDKRAWQKGSVEYQRAKEALREYFSEHEPNPQKLLSGYAASGGMVEGEVKRLNMFIGSDIDQEMKKMNEGDILVTEMTRPQFLLAIRRAGAIVTDQGGNLCHAAIVAREFNIPAVVGTQRATKVLQDEQRIIVDGDNGTIYEA